MEGEARVLPHQCFFRDNDVEVFTRSFCLRCGPDTPGGVSLREFFGIMRIDLALHGRAVGLRPPQRENSEFLSPGHLASGILDMVYFI